MQRVIWHWTAGGNKANAVDKAAYHFIIESDGTIVRGIHRIEDNEDVSDGHYARHTRNLNTGSIGLALAGMHDAKERPFDKGPYPITPEQTRELCRFTARLCHEYDIPVTPTTVLTHAEVQPVLKVPQNNKWDITWLPGMVTPGDPVPVGNRLRQGTMDYYRQMTAKPAPVTKTRSGRSLIEVIKELLKALGIIK